MSPQRNYELPTHNIMEQIIQTLNTISEGWTSNGRVFASSHISGGIIDENMAGLGWFVIFNDGRDTIEGLDSLEMAVEAFRLA